ncbi:hypothetical protein FEA48_30590 [Pseudomonas nitroreducens]|uniref:Uncharacterized protein n=1 Tax=Pseudomonas nitroreducens TaxID=46680 RepID=A0A5R8ZQ72_PSENT|nr:hypothetical protein [Pseudomonas nitroreducens]TLP68204.1 hypothetical protein FEA48_30590 [Pseudomonas nitroreducens]
MDSFYYRSCTPRIVALVRAWYLERDIFEAQRKQLSAAFGAEASAMRGIDSQYIGGLKLPPAPDLDVHWRQPDNCGLRNLRAAGQPPKGASKTERTAIRKEHTRLVELWQEHCPKRISSHSTWQQLGINTGNLWLSGGIMFELDGVAYFNLGFPINEHEHLAKVANHQPSYGWIEGAEEILSSAYFAARDHKDNRTAEEAAHAA